MLTLDQKTKTRHIMINIQIIDAIQLSLAYSRDHGEHIDWHEFSYYLDELHRAGCLEISQPGGMTQYKLTISSNP